MKFSFRDITNLDDMIDKIGRQKYVDLSPEYHWYGLDRNKNIEFDLLQLLSRRIMLHKFKI